MITIAGTSYDLSHLADFIVTVPGKGRDNADLRVSVSLSLHVISTKCTSGNHDLIDANHKPRRFCLDRYNASLHLPKKIEKAILGNYFTWESKDINNAVNYAVIDVPPTRVLNLTDGVHEVFYYYLYPGDGTRSDVNFVVLSHYRRQVKFNPHRRRFNIHALLRKCLFENRRIP